MKSYKYSILAFFVAFLFIGSELSAQRMPHSRGGGGASRGGSARTHSGSINGGARQSPSRPATTNRQSANRGASPNRSGSANKSGARNKPSTGNVKPKNTPQQSRPSKPSTGAANGNKKTKAGGASTQPVNGKRPSTQPDKGNRPNAGNRPNNGNKPGNGNRPGNGSGDRNINIDNSKNVNINRNVQVNNHHHNAYYNGYRGYHPYHYHPYHPYYYGPMWHPVGFFITAVAVTAVVVSVQNSQATYYYDNGVYYTEVSGGYKATVPEKGTTVQTIPDEREKITLNETDYYYYGGIFYKKSNTGYTVIPSPDGAMVTHIPEGGEEIEIGEDKYVFYNGTYFLPFVQNGQNMYQVVEMVPAEASESEPAEE